MSRITMIGPAGFACWDAGGFTFPPDIWKAVGELNGDLSDTEHARNEFYDGASPTTIKWFKRFCQAGGAAAFVRGASILGPEMECRSLAALLGADPWGDCIST
jgi:hypothetical protein